MTIPQSIFLRGYRGLLTLYPAPFRAKYAEQMLDAARQEHHQCRRHGRLAAALLWDTLKGAWRENMRFPAPTNTFSYLGFAALFSFLLLCLYVGLQQRWRRADNTVPEQIVEAMRAGRGPELNQPTQEISSPAWLHGSSAFAATFDADGNAIASNARLHGALPQPPRGIFAVVRRQGRYSVSWQPEPGVRVALTGATLPNGGFAASGQSLEPSETRSERMGVLLLFMWGLMMAGLGLSAAMRKPTQRQVSGP